MEPWQDGLVDVVEVRALGVHAAFAVTVDDQRSFQDAVRQKLLLEIAGKEPAASQSAALR